MKILSFIILTSFLMLTQLNAQVFESETNKTKTSKVENLKTEVVTAKTENTKKEGKANPKKSASEQVKIPKAIEPPAGYIPASLIRMGKGQYFSKTGIILDKSKRTLSLWVSQENGVPKHIKSFPSDHGRKKGDKMILGDLKTPEGIYFFQRMYKGNQLNYNEYGKRAFTTNYPNFFDTSEKKTGSGIWLHAIPKTKTLFRGSRGCVVVRNDVIEYLKEHITLKTTPIIIEEEVAYLPVEEFVNSQKEFSSWLQGWVHSWSNKNIEKYMSFYSEDFKSQKMNKSQWRDHKKYLNEKYNFISVSAKEPIIFSHGDEVSITFAQRYQSDLLKDFGMKTLYLKKTDGKFSILKEHWRSSKEILQEPDSQNIVNSTAQEAGIAEKTF